MDSTIYARFLFFGFWLATPFNPLISNATRARLLFPCCLFHSFLLGDPSIYTILFFAGIGICTHTISSTFDGKYDLLDETS